MRNSINLYGLIGLVIVLGAAWIYYALKADVPKLYITELMANNVSCCPDTTTGRPEFDDWIEIHNPGNQPVDIGGMYFSQHRNSPLGHRIPQGVSEQTTIPPGGYLIIWADGDDDQGALHLRFKLSHHGEFLGLYFSDGRTIDTLHFTPQSENASYGRSMDGNWKSFTTPSPGRANP
jgi:hypothetical protein